MIITFFKVPYIIIINFNSRNVQCNKFVENSWSFFGGGWGWGGYLGNFQYVAEYIQNTRYFIIRSNLISYLYISDNLALGWGGGLDKGSASPICISYHDFFPFPKYCLYFKTVLMFFCGGFYYLNLSYNLF